MEDIGRTRRTIEESFRMVPDRMTFDDSLEPGDVRVWCCLAFLARFPAKDHLESTDATIAGKLGVSQQTIRRALLRLERARYISRRREGLARIISLNPSGNGSPIPEFSLRVAAVG